MSTIYDENIEAIESGGGYVDREWLEAARGAGDMRAEAEISKGGLCNIRVEMTGTRTLHLHSRFDPRGEAGKALGDPGAWSGRHAVACGLGCGYHIEALRAAAGEGGAVTALECNPWTALVTLENIDLTRLAGGDGVRLLIGAGKSILPLAFRRIRELEAASETPVAKLFMHKPSVSTLPPSEKHIKARLGVLREDVFIEGHDADPRIARAFDSIRKKRLSGGSLSGFDTALLFVESVFSEERYFYYDAPHENAVPPVSAAGILIVSLNAIGDVVMASTLFSALRESYPSARIILLTERPSQSLYERADPLDRVFSYSRKEFAADYIRRRSIGSIEKAARMFTDLTNEVMGENINVVFNAHPSARSAVLAGALGINPERILGHIVGPDGEQHVRGPLWSLANHLDKIPTDVRQEERKLLMFGLAPCVRKLNVEVRGAGERAGAFEGAIRAGPGARRVVGVNPFASSGSRSWPLERYAELCRALISGLNADVLIFAGVDSGERAAAERLCRESGPRAAGCIGAPLAVAAQAAAGCALFITNDTGPMHFSGAAGARCLAICGPTLNLPYNSIGHIAVAADMDCAFCGPFPQCERPECFEKIETRDVLHIVEIMLSCPGEESLRALSGTIGDDGLPLRLFTTGFHDSVVPRYFIRVRDTLPPERSIAVELVEIAVFSAMRRLEADENRANAFAPNACAAFSSPLEPAGAREDTLRRYSFVNPDYHRLRKDLGLAADFINAKSQAADAAGSCMNLRPESERRSRGEATAPPGFRAAMYDPTSVSGTEAALFRPLLALEAFLRAAGLSHRIGPTLDSCAVFIRSI